MTLAELLADNRRMAPEYRGGLTNHASMALVALAALGADDAALARFWHGYKGRLEPLASWPLADEIREEIRAHGRAAVLRARLQQAAPGAAGGAFHGIIRTAFAVRAGDDDEIAQGLAYLAQVAQPLVAPAGGRETELGPLVERLRASGIEKPSRLLITEGLEKVAADPRFLAVAGDVGVDGSTLSQVSLLGARWYLGAGDFVTLHVLTGAHALRTLLPWIHEPAPALHALAVAALACFVVSGMPAVVDARGKERADDAELAARAIASDDDHLAKLVVACRDEEAAWNDLIYRIVATRAARAGHT